MVPAYEGEMGLLKDHISIISFLKPGIIKVNSKSGEENFYVEDGIVEFKDNNLSILTSSIFNMKEMSKDKTSEMLKSAEEASARDDLTDQNRFILDQKIEVLKQLIKYFFNFIFHFFVKFQLKLYNQVSYLV